MTVPASTFFHRSPLRLWSEKYIFMVFLEMIQMKNNYVIFLCNCITGSALAELIVLLLGQHLALGWPHQILATAWQWVDGWNLICLQGLAKNLSLQVSRLCCGCTSRCANVYWYFLSDVIMCTCLFLKKKISVTGLPSMRWRMASPTACVLSALTN